MERILIRKLVGCPLEKRKLVTRPETRIFKKKKKNQSVSIRMVACGRADGCSGLVGDWIPIIIKTLDLDFLSQLSTHTCANNIRHQGYLPH
jgi:hypothetical protein